MIVEADDPTFAVLEADQPVRETRLRHAHSPDKGRLRRSIHVLGEVLDAVHMTIAVDVDQLEARSRRCDIRGIREGKPIAGVGHPRGARRCRRVVEVGQLLRGEGRQPNQVRPAVAVELGKGEAAAAQSKREGHGRQVARGFRAVSVRGTEAARPLGNPHVVRFLGSKDGISVCIERDRERAGVRLNDVGQAIPVQVLEADSVVEPRLSNF